MKINLGDGSQGLVREAGEACVYMQHMIYFLSSMRWKIGEVGKARMLTPCLHICLHVTSTFNMVHTYLNESAMLLAFLRSSAYRRGSYVQSGLD